MILRGDNQDYSLIGFSASDSQDLFEDYLRVKYSVFVEECGWNELPSLKENKIALPDPYDEIGKFVLVKDRNQPIGIARGINIEGDFPHKELFAELLNSKAMAAILEKLSTINAVAILKDFRGTLVTMEGYRERITLGAAILFSIVKLLKSHGASVVLISSDPLGAGIFFRRLGFYVLTFPYRYAASPTMLVNMSLIINEKDKFQNLNSPMALISGNSSLTREEIKAKKYFETLDTRYSSTVTSSGRINSFDDR